MTVNHYAILGIPIDASADEIRGAYRELVRKVHPDANLGDPRASETFLRVQKAYEILSDIHTRRAFDETLPTALKTPPADVQVYYSRNVLSPTKEPQIVYSFIRIQPNQADAVNEKPPLNICLAIDCSTSMQGLILDTVKSTAIELIRQMGANDILSVVAFSDRAEIVVPASPNQDRHRVEMSIRLLQTSGGTELYQGLEAAYRETMRNRSTKYINHIILITDGRTYGDEAISLRLAEQCGKQQIGISGMGIGGKWNDVFLDKMAALSGGTTMFISKPRDVSKFLLGSYAS